MKLGTYTFTMCMKDNKVVRGKFSWSKVPLFCWLHVANVTHIADYVLTFRVPPHLNPWTIQCSAEVTKEGLGALLSLWKKDRDRASFQRRGWSGVKNVISLLPKDNVPFITLIKVNLFLIQRIFLSYCSLITVSSIHKILQELVLPSCNLNSKGIDCDCDQQSIS